MRMWEVQTPARVNCEAADTAMFAEPTPNSLPQFRGLSWGLRLLPDQCDARSAFVDRLVVELLDGRPTLQDALHFADFCEQVTVNWARGICLDKGPHMGVDHSLQNATAADRVEPRTCWPGRPKSLIPARHVRAGHALVSLNEAGTHPMRRPQAMHQAQLQARQDLAGVARRLERLAATLDLSTRMQPYRLHGARVSEIWPRFIATICP